MLVHASTAPNAVLRALPSLPATLWGPSAEAAWSASAAIHAAYGPRDARPPAAAQSTAHDAFAQAVDHGDEHVIKLADTALDVFAWTSDPVALSAIAQGSLLVARP